jgi:hypothetical protein
VVTQPRFRASNRWSTIAGHFRQLYEDEAGRRITDPAPGPLFADRSEDGELETGTINVLRSRSDHPFVAEHREVIHKIGVTSGSVETRISSAEKSSTYLLAGVDVVARYKVYGVNCQKLESLLHKVFAAAQLDILIPDRFGHQVKPREWFVLPLDVINEAVDRIRDRSITAFRYSPSDGKLVQTGNLVSTQKAGCPPRPTRSFSYFFHENCHHLS